MSISRVEFKNRKPELRYDVDLKRWIGYKVDVRVNGKRPRPIFRTKAEAERFLTELRSKKVYERSGLKHESRSGVPRLSEFFAERLKAIVDHKANVRATGIFSTFEGLFESDPLVTAVQRKHYRLYIKLRQADGVKNETINREINELSSTFSKAAEMFPDELDDFDPPKTARPEIRRGKRPHREITAADAAALIESIRTDRTVREHPQRTENRPIVAWMFELAWLLGLRIGETEQLVKKDRDVKANSLKVERWKTKTVSVFTHLPDAVNKLLDTAIEHSTTDRVFDLTCSRNTVERIIREACIANDIPYGRGKEDAITFHSTRHSFTSRLVRVTDMATAGSFTGHSSEEMVDYYAHADEDSRRLAMEKLYGPKADLNLREIYKKVRARRMSEDEFLAALK